MCVSCSVVPDSLRPHGLQSTRLLCPWDFPGKDTGVGCHFLLWGIFPIQGSNPCLLHCRQTLYCLSHQGRPLCMQKWRIHSKFSLWATYGGTCCFYFLLFPCLYVLFSCNKHTKKKIRKPMWKCPSLIYGKGRRSWGWVHWDGFHEKTGCLG